MKKTKIGLAQISILTAIIFLNTGCVFGLFGDEPEVQKKTAQTAQPTPIIPTTSTTFISTKKVNYTAPTMTTAVTPIFSNIVTECSDDINAQNSCQKKLIGSQELTPKRVVTPIGGEVHKLRSIQGKDVTIIERPTGYRFPQFENKVVILEMFGKNCSHCIKEMPIMNRLYRQYRNQLEIVALQVEGKMSTIQANALIKRHGITYPLISGETATNLQYHVQSTYGWTGILPFIMVIKDGVTEFTYRGQVTYKEINKDIRSLIN